MENEKINTNAGFSEEEESSFDIMEWLLYILKYWYLIVISVAAFSVWAYMQNRKWMPQYTVGAKVVIENDRRNSGDASSVLMGFSGSGGYRGLNNQMMLFGSSDLVRRTVKKLPLTVEYWTLGKFKSRNMYKNSPIEIKPLFVADKTYGMGFFRFTDIDGVSYKIEHENAKENDLEFTGMYGKPLSNSYFFITVDKTGFFVDKGTFFIRFRTEDDLTTEFHDKMNFNFAIKGASVLDLTVSGSQTPERDIDFINAHCDEFLQDNLDRKNEIADKTLDFINTQLGLVEDSLAAAQADLGRFRTANEILDEQTYSFEITSLIKKNKEANEALILKKAYIDYLNDYLRGNIKDDELVMPVSFGISDGSLTSLITEYRKAKNLRDNVGPENPFYPKYQEELEQSKQLILEALKNIDVAYQIEFKDLERKNAELRRKMLTYTENEAQMKYLERIYKIQDDYYALLLKKRVDALIQKSSNSPDNIIMERARILSMDNGSVKSKNYSQKMMMGLALPLVILVLIKLLHFTVQNRSEVKKITQYPILGSVANDVGGGTNPYVIQQHANSVFAESFRLLRTQIEFTLGQKKDGGAVILTTSAQPGDGKSYFCLNLAAIYAVMGKKVLLMGCDMRKPSLAEKLNEKDKRHKGLTNYLTGQLEFDEILLPKSDDKEQRRFDLILSGSIPPNPGDLMHSEKLRQLIADMRKQYDYIIIDTAPLGLVSDALALVKEVDVTLFVVRYNHTAKKFLKGTTEMCREAGVENIYVVLNDETEKQWSYRYGTYGRYGRYSRYGKYGRYGKSKDDGYYYTYYYVEDETKARKRDK